MLNHILFLILSSLHPEPQRFQITGLAQGTSYSIIYYANDSLISKQSIDSIFISLNKSLSLYEPSSLINKFNASKKQLVHDTHLKTVVAKSLETYHRTNGIFDITVFPFVSAWGFGPKKQSSVPDSNTITKLRQCVSSSFLSLKKNRLVKSKPCVSIDLNGIAQGYSVDVICNFLSNNGISIFMVEIGGEIRARGVKPDNHQRFSIAIESPQDVDGLDEYENIVELPDGAITTSGSYRRYYESNGTRIHHLINPKTGYPQKNEMISATVFAADAITADAYDNVFMVAGIDSSFAFLNRNRFLEAYFVFKDDDGKVRDTCTTGFRALFRKSPRND